MIHTSLSSNTNSKRTMGKRTPWNSDEKSFFSSNTMGNVPRKNEIISAMDIEMALIKKTWKIIKEQICNRMN